MPIANVQIASGLNVELTIRLNARTFLVIEIFNTGQQEGRWKAPCRRWSTLPLPPERAVQRFWC